MLIFSNVSSVFTGFHSKLGGEVDFGTRTLISNSKALTKTLAVARLRKGYRQLTLDKKIGRLGGAAATAG